MTLNEQLQTLVGKTVKEISNGHGSCTVIFADDTVVYFDSEYHDPQVEFPESE